MLRIFYQLEKEQIKAIAKSQCDFKTGDIFDSLFLGKRKLFVNDHEIDFLEGPIVDFLAYLCWVSRQALAGKFEILPYSDQDTLVTMYLTLRGERLHIQEGKNLREWIEVEQFFDVAHETAYQFLEEILKIAPQYQNSEIKDRLQFWITGNFYKT